MQKLRQQIPRRGDFVGFEDLAGVASVVGAMRDDAVYDIDVIEHADGAVQCAGMLGRGDCGELVE